MAQRRFCRRKFERTGTVVAHEGRCNAEPVSQCRYCTDTHSPTETPKAHLKSCDAYGRAAQRQAEDDHAEPDTTNDISDENNEEHFSRRFIEPQPHGFYAYLKWNCADLDNLSPRSYFGLRSLQEEHDFEEYGRLRTTTSIDGDEWAIEFGFKSCRLAPRNAENFQLDEVREYLVYVYPSAYSSWGDAKSAARERAYFRISPRWPDIETKEGVRSMSNLCDIRGSNVEVEGSNWAFEQYPEVSRQALAALADRQGFRFNSPTPIRTADFEDERSHGSSNIVDGEQYVRVAKGKTGRVFA